MRLKDDAPNRSAMDVGAGDYVKIGSQWRRIESNPIQGAAYPPRDWSISTEVGTYGAWGINRYAKAEDLSSD